MDIRSPKTPYTFQTFESMGGARIFRIPMKVFPDLWAYAYLVLVDDQVVLIDTGSGFGDSNAHLEAGFTEASRVTGRTIRFEDLTHILITHGHIDHFGGLVFLHERTHALIGIHELDLGNLANYEQRVAIAMLRLKAYLVEVGVPDQKRDAILNMYSVNKSLSHSVRVDFTYEAGGMRLGAFDMLHVPGHSAGHVVIRLHNLLFSGDHVLGRISPHQSPERLTLSTGLGHYLDSLALLDKWATGSYLTLAGHDDPILNLPKRTAEIRQQHTSRLNLILEFLSVPHTIADVSERLFGSVNGYHVLLAIEEAGAHVEYLHQRNLLRIVNMDELESDYCPVVIRYQRIEARDPENVNLINNAPTAEEFPGRARPEET
jgi:glyoxylase-like metal-dependent hydrolase (beta-lactamase superfamily II)